MLALPAGRRGVLEAEPPRAPQASGLPPAVVRLGDGCDGFGGLVSGVGRVIATGAGGAGAAALTREVWTGRSSGP
jgi:hypothetical protein